MTSEDAKKALLKLFQCYNLAGTETERKIKFECYWEVLVRLHPSFVVEACEYAARGKCGDGRFLPAVGELYQVGQEFAARSMQAKRESAPRLPQPVCQNDLATPDRIHACYEKVLTDLC